MAQIKMKNCTDLNQSKKLQEILPLESADMTWQVVRKNRLLHLGFNTERYNNYSNELIPAWSLAALVNTLRKNFEVSIIGYEKAWKCHVTNRKTLVTDWFLADNPIDCCYEMILKLHKMNLL